MFLKLVSFEYLIFDNNNFETKYLWQDILIAKVLTYILVASNEVNLQEKVSEWWICFFSVEKFKCLLLKFICCNWNKPKPRLRCIVWMTRHFPPQLVSSDCAFFYNTLFWAFCRSLFLLHFFSAFSSNTTPKMANVVSLIAFIIQYVNLFFICQRYM
jgi:hypothetical protein